MRAPSAADPATPTNPAPGGNCGTAGWAAAGGWDHPAPAHASAAAAVANPIIRRLRIEGLMKLHRLIAAIRAAREPGWS